MFRSEVIGDDAKFFCILYHFGPFFDLLIPMAEKKIKFFNKQKRSSRDYEFTPV